MKFIYSSDEIKIDRLIECENDETNASFTKHQTG